ncbi:hypothetical protein QFZ79_002539 [Arthrobacter sp. V4I6]|uniref:DUF6492 family protein n=1 Tax=unclassified Arthrobacter TaxID=235627 RepID=UPI0027809942|nr:MULTISPECIES: DUF6492 family protein [unclassified Arthrobacter]MDQ0820245.1 hypothetical protein [Arthrobacter sp. V1I7]MDQ0854428.1 hypothetical protein [Arthrobacter sp. V4I6]
MPRNSLDVDLVTITFEGDVRLTVLQILSVDRLLDHSSIGRYIVVLNGQNNAQLEALLKTNTESRIAPGLAAKIDYVKAPTLLPGHNSRGWRGQQLLKLVVANHLAARYYLLLDAKNHFVHRTLVRDFFTETAIKTFRRAAPQIYYSHIKKSFGAFAAEDRAGEYTESAMPTVTPYLMDAGLVRGMMSELESKYAGRAFEDLFEKELSGTTEFFLYCAYLVATGQESLYEDSAPMVVTLFTKWPQDHKDVMRLVNSAISNKVAMFGLHRRRLPQLNDEQRDSIVKLWNTELLTAYEDPAWFMEIDHPMSTP